MRVSCPLTAAKGLTTATWFFGRDVAARAEPQHGPVTFVLVKTADGWPISGAHFANDPPTRR